VTVRLNARTVIGVVIGGAALGWMGWQISKDFDALWAVLRSSHAGWWAGAVVSATAIFALRAIRWRVILDPVAERLPFGMLWRATTIGMMVNNFIPRGGELVRAYALTRETPRVGSGRLVRIARRRPRLRLRRHPPPARNRIDAAARGRRPGGG
jgi:uncharacterized membrane protein YbhN (UPF0104 family)